MTGWKSQPTFWTARARFEQFEWDARAVQGIGQKGTGDGRPGQSVNKWTYSIS
jgi:hypothetical protein